jgi:hypothetical protein
MAEPESPFAAGRASPPRDRTFWWATALTLVVLLGGGVWIFLQWPPANELAPFAVVIAAVLAVIWFVFTSHRQLAELGLQREELALQRHALELQADGTRRLAEQAALQVEVLKETSRTARRDSFMRLLELYERRLVLEASQISSAIAVDPAASADHQQAWTEYEQGDRNALFRHLIRQLVRGGHKDFMDRIEQVANGRAILQKYATTVAEALNEAAAADEKLATLCWSSEWAYLFRLLERPRNS